MVLSCTVSEIRRLIG